ncbi:RHS repeat-associated core domain-containing protein, partial [Taibaiella helva]|uniref:RHS repeat-associated core domain-containing protein n=1 Tax=Taibaiella helva TaxID=2301235 RepID=UPI0029370E84
GVKPGTGPVDMDILDYKYTNGNQLDAVSDQGIADYGAGDFQNGHSGSGDYAYDGNGNLSKDLNKGIGSVTYNHFNKPVAIDLGGGKKIEYSYDAAGSKVQELVIDPGKPTKRTDYIGNFIYRNDTLQYALTAGGRTVFDYGSTTPVKEEYFVKDHLGNVRSTIDIITYEIRQYLATYEVASANLEGMLFEKVGEIRDEKPASTDPSDSKAGRLNGAEAGREVGTSLLVKVMAGDRVDMNVNNYYETFEGNTTEPVTAEQMMGSIISTLTNGVGGLPGESHNTKLVNELFTQENFSALENVIQDQGIDPDRPQAYLTYALFDENMKLVSEFAGAYQANGNGAWGSIGSNGAKVIPANGYLAVYLSSRWRDLQCIPCSNMFFDKLNVEVSKGNLLEENHYYPHGLPIQPLSSVSTNFRENRRKYQSNEYIKDLGLNWMDFQARQYDPQIGRFLAVDPLADAGGQQVWSPYAAMGNAPESNVDPNGTVALNLTLARLFNSEMLPSRRIDFFPTANMYMPGGSLFKSGIGSIFDGKSWGGLTGSALESYVNSHATQAASIMGEVFETGAFANAGRATEEGQAQYASAMTSYENVVKGMDFSVNGVGGTLLTYDPKGPRSMLGVLDSWSNNFGNWLGSLAKSSQLGTAFNAADRRLKNHGVDKYEGPDGYANYGLPVMKATFAFNLTLITGGIGGLGAVTWGNIAFAGDNLLDVGTGGKYSVAAVAKKNAAVFAMYNTASVGFGVFGIIGSYGALIRNANTSTFLLNTSDKALFMYYWSPVTAKGLQDYYKKK